jgi:SH3-like domain-containing protein
MKYWLPGGRRFVVNTLLPFLVFLLLVFPYRTDAQDNTKNEFFSIANPAVILYDAPSLNAEKLYVASVNLPVEVVVKVEGWLKVRDSNGHLAWVESKNLSKKRFVIVNVPVADVHQSADHNSPLMFRAQQDVVLEWLGTASSGNWSRVRHQDGQTGYIRIDQIWGV